MLEFWLIHSYRNATFRGKQNLHTVVLILVNYVSSQKLLVEQIFSHVQHKSALRLSNLFLERSVKQ